MKTLTIKTVAGTKKALWNLEKKGLISVLRPTPKVIKTKTLTGAVDVYYQSAARFGGHCLMGVGKRNTEIVFSFHPDNEDLILLKPRGKKYKPLYFVLSRLKKDRFLRALGSGTLSGNDLTAVELKFNDPETMVFTVMKDTVHCEITVPGAGQHPVFFVSEPSKLKMNNIKTKLKFRISGA